jgi:adenine-specific DNA-methyltransferase
MSTRPGKDKSKPARSPRQGRGRIASKAPAPERRRGARAAEAPPPIAPAPVEAAGIPAVRHEQTGGPVRVTAAKGRPMLVWVGKRPLSHVTAFPAQAVERFAAGEQTAWSGATWQDWPAAYPPGGLLFHGDNKEVLAHLLANGFRGKVNLIYIDPPFDSGADYVRKVSLRGATGSAKIDGDQYTLGEQIQYTDIWANDNYLQFMYERLLLLKELLSADGSLYVHVDARKAHHLRALLDEAFGSDAFRNQIAWKRTSAHAGASQYGAVTDYLLFYTADPAGNTWNQQFQSLTEVHRARHYRHTDERGVYALGELTAPGLRRGPSGDPWHGFNPSAIGRHWGNLPSALERLDAQGMIYWPERPGAWPRLKRYESDLEGRSCTDFWDDLDPINMVGSERENYPTQKPEGLLERIIASSSNPGDLVLDCFVGSGTTAAVAQKLGRRWIACDINKGAIQTTAKRLQTVMREQVEESQQRAAAGEQGNLLGEEPKKEQPAAPAQLSFSVWRVNDYDLQIQHNEAVALACEHIGVQRTRTDSFFDGTLGRRLVKIIPFDHPLSPADLEELRRELDGRPAEDREMTLVCLGMEIAATAWIDDWNRLRKGRNAANKVHVIELRTDQKYGRFIRHEPARASVKVRRRNGRLSVAIDEFISPGIIERLRQQAGVLQPMIEDWRAMVDCVMIDPAWDGRVFNVALSDIPERKTDLVQGTYDLPAPSGETTVAVKIIDMLGEEVIVTSQV